MSKHEETVAKFHADPTDPRHGTPNGYGNLRCRCDDCKASYSEKNRDYRALCNARNPPCEYCGEAPIYSMRWKLCRTCTARYNTNGTPLPQPRIDPERVKTLVSEGYTPNEIAAEIGYTPAGVYSHIRKMGLKTQTTAQRNRAMIAKMHADGMTNIEISRATGLDKSGVGQLIKRMGLTRNMGPRGY